jgi:virulence-associated protein VapD
MNLCIFRNINNCKSCCFRTRGKYCNLHSNNENLIYEIINDAIGIKQITSVTDIYDIFSYIYNNPDIYTKELIFKKILKTLYIKQSYLRNIFINYSREKIIFNYDAFISKIHELNYNTYLINKKLEKVNYKSLSIIKKFFKSIIIKPHIYNPNVSYINETDPFTLELIRDIPKKELFVFNDGINNTYCFKANEFRYFMRTNGYWNPYTKNMIDIKLIRVLDYYIDYFKLNIINDRRWNTIEQAFTDVAIAIEKVGFYTNTQWYLKLTTKHIKNIIRLFKIISTHSNNQQPNDYFNDLIDINNDNIFYNFAIETIRLFENGDSNFLLCCNFMKAIGVYSNDFYNSLPEWISDIESPIIINNYVSRQRDIDIVYLINIIES